MSHVCDKCGNPAKLRCSRCKSVWYCNDVCQRGHWKTHKSSCSKLRGEDVGAGGGGVAAASNTPKDVVAEIFRSSRFLTCCRADSFFSIDTGVEPNVEADPPRVVELQLVFAPAGQVLAGGTMGDSYEIAYTERFLTTFDSEFFGPWEFAHASVILPNMPPLPSLFHFWYPYYKDDGKLDVAGDAMVRAGVVKEVTRVRAPGYYGQQGKVAVLYKAVPEKVAIVNKGTADKQSDRVKRWLDAGGINLSKAVRAKGYENNE